MIGYGLASSAQIKYFAQAVCDVLGGGAEVVSLLCETAAAETLCGTLPDRTRHGAGRGLFQCDRVAFDDVVARARTVDIKALESAFDFNLREVSWEQLNYSPLIAAAFARLHYKLRPEPVPLTLKGRADYWKRYYNTTAGKGNANDYVFKAQAWARYF